ncbi:MAG: hypothetical protein JWR59_2438 [Brevundimonas sp.]|nr:hypothetical protein [Brevundimonas sp.]
MSSLATSNGRPTPRINGPNIVLIVALCLICAAALSGVTYLLWPTWRAAPVGDPGRLPITIGSALFNVPSAAIRTKVQRRAGPQERIDLAFTYPSLLPPEPQARVSADTIEDKPVASDRLFLSIATDGDIITPTDRARTIYPRYVDVSGDTQDGLMGRPFREASPYRGEDLFTADTPIFVVRCTREAMTPGMCLSERRVNGAHLTFRFPREWLSDWRGVASAMDQVVEKISGHGK